MRMVAADKKRTRCTVPPVPGKRSGVLDQQIAQDTCSEAEMKASAVVSVLTQRFHIIYPARKEKGGVISFSSVGAKNPRFPPWRQHWGAPDAGCGQASVNGSVGGGHAV